MKKTIRFMSFIASVVMALFVVSCSSDDDAVKTATVTMQLVAPADASGLSLSGKIVELKGAANSYTATTDAAGKAVFTGVIPDIYSAATSWSISADDYRAATNKEVGNTDFNVNGSALNITVATDLTTEINLSIAEKQSLVISKVYYAGCKDANTKNYDAGQFIEIFNNSDQAVNIAGLYLGLLESESTPAYIISNQKDYIYIKQLYRFPSDKSYMVEAGKSIVITNSAIDHTATSSDIYDLSKANFECKDASGKTTNNPDVPAMELKYSTYAAISKMNILNSGSMSVVLIKTSEDIDSWEKVYAEGKDKGNMFLKTPAKYVVDGVDIMKNTTTGIDVAKKRLYNFIDAGFTNIESVTGRTGEVVYRKLDKTVDGRMVLVDTNNSSNDWKVASRDEAIKVGEYK